MKYDALRELEMIGVALDETRKTLHRAYGDIDRCKIRLRAITAQLLKDSEAESRPKHG